MINKIFDLKKQYPDIHYRVINYGFKDNIFFVLSFYCCDPTKNIDFMSDLKRMVNEVEDLDGLYLNNYLIIHKKGYTYSAILEIERLKKIKSFDSACQLHMNKRLNKE